MIINCPKCKSELELPDDAAGFRVECDSCGEKFNASDAVFNKGMEIFDEAERAQADGRIKDAMAKWAEAVLHFRAAAEARHLDALFMVGVLEMLQSPKFQDEVNDAPQGAKAAVALLFWYWKNGKQLDGGTRQRYEVFRNAREERLDEASLKFLLAEYEGMNSASDVERLKEIIEMRRVAAAEAASREAAALAQYVVPDGALHDRPKSEFEVTNDNPMLLSDGFAITPLICSGCGKPFKAAYRKLVNLTKNYGIKCAIMDGTYFRFTCPHCKKSASFDFRMSVYDIMKRFFIRSFDNLQSMLSVHKNRSSFQGSQLGFPDEFLPLVRHRLVLGPLGLAEKVRIFEAGLDDYAIESLKQSIIQNQSGGLVFKEMFFDHRDKEKLYFNILLEDGKLAMSQASNDMYARVKSVIDTAGKFSEGVFRWVDRQTMYGQFADMDNWWVPDEIPERPQPKKKQPKQRPLRAGDTISLKLGNGVEIVFRWCPPGRFFMGNASCAEWYTLCKEVTLTRGFWIAQTPITRRQYAAVMAGTVKPGEEDLPMTGVSVEKCLQFCEGMTRCLGSRYRMDLPTEAQWEYAARAGTTGDFGTNESYSGSYDQDYQRGCAALGRYAWTQSNSGNHFHPVGQKEPNNWGICDMLGNVYEFVKDAYSTHFKRVNPIDPCVINKRRNASAIMRGGCYYKDWIQCAVWERREVGKSGAEHIGFRVVIAEW